MIVLDTNVLSEPLRAHPSPAVLRWLSTNPTATITAISVGEILSGVERMPEGLRKTALAEAVLAAIGGVEVLAYDDSAARVFAKIQQTRRKLGRPQAVEDGMIAAICLSHGAALATRNTKDFDGLGLEVINPWR